MGGEPSKGGETVHCERAPAAGEEQFPLELDALWSSALVRRAACVVRGVRGSIRKHPALSDVLLALFVMTIGLVDLVVARAMHHSFVPSGASIPAALATIAGQAIPLVWRRRAPSVVLAAVLVCCVLQWYEHVVVRSSIGLLIALYSVARYDSIKRLPWAALWAAAGLTFAAFRLEFFRQQGVSGLFVLYCVVTAAIASALLVRVRLAQLSAVADRRARLEAEREQRAQLATLTERSRVSREMHDIVGHNLAVITGLADGAAADPDAERSAEILKLIAATSRQALSEIRRTLGVLREDGRPDGAVDLAPQPGTADLAGLLERTRAAGPRISYLTAGDHDAMAPGVQLTVYRVIQEALTNSLKHAGPETSVRVSLRVTDVGEVEISVRDTGPAQKSQIPAAQSDTGQGLLGIAERAALAGGSAQAGPTQDGGWLVHVVLPLLPLPALGDSQP